jgi:hypothetical protein
LVYSTLSSNLGLAQRGNVSLRLALSDELLLIFLGKNRSNIDTFDNLVAAHKISVETGSCSDSGEGNESTKDVASGRGHVESRNNSVETESNGARGSHSGEIRLDQDRVRHGRRLVAVGSVECDVERLVEDLPAHNTSRSHAGLEHTSGNDKVGEYIAGHSEGEEDGFAGICCTVSRQLVLQSHMSDRVIYTGVQCRVDHFLRMPQCWRHVLDLAGLVISHQRLGRLESGLAREEGSEDRASIVSFTIL